MDLLFRKDNFDINKTNSELKSFCTSNNIDDDELLKIQLINEEFLFNILFPNFEDEIKLSIFKKDNNTTLSYEYSGIDYMKKINEETIVSHKIIQNKTTKITSNTIENQTTVCFTV